MKRPHPFRSFPCMPCVLSPRVVRRRSSSPAHAGHEGIARYLIDKGAEAYIGDEEGRGAGCVALARG